MLTWLLVAFGVAIGSALFPLLSAELFVVGLVSKHPHMPWLALGAILAIGQVLGKLLYYYAGRGSFRLPAFLHRQSDTATPTEPADPPTDTRWRRIMAWLRVKWVWLHDRCHRHPGWMLGVTAVSAVLGVPPFMAMTVLFGVADLSARMYLLVALPGRFVRFSLLAAAPEVFHYWLQVHA